jgi:hypothetical protein
VLCVWVEVARLRMWRRGNLTTLGRWRRVESIMGGSGVHERDEFMREKNHSPERSKIYT